MADTLVRSVNYLTVCAVKTVTFMIIHTDFYSRNMVDNISRYIVILITCIIQITLASGPSLEMKVLSYHYHLVYSDIASNLPWPVDRIGNTNWQACL